MFYENAPSRGISRVPPIIRSIPFLQEAFPSTGSEQEMTWHISNKVIKSEQHGQSKRCDPQTHRRVPMEHIAITSQWFMRHYSNQIVNPETGIRLQVLIVIVTFLTSSYSTLKHHL